MSAPKKISPMLDGFTMGEAISAHNGVVCYPAIRDDNNDKYIVKVISVPASNVQLAALLLSGAYSSRADALAYYADRAQEILREVRTMNELSHLDGFIPYLDAQVVEKEDGTGYEVYLLNEYRQSLAQAFTEGVMTHKAIFDLAMDLCSALSACRSAGYLYIDLKPENIFFTADYGYRISDLGFLSLSSLKYASLPDKYHNAYTAPEIQDAVSELNTTLDTYALGLILYQAYNGGILRLEDRSDDGLLPPPVYADYEMAEIILTACHPDPGQRWQSPTELGQALVQYMQRNSVDDISILPAPVSTPELDVGEDFLPEEDMAEDEDWQSIPELAFMQELVSDETAPSAENTSDISNSSMSEETSQILALADDLIAHTLPDPVVPPAPIEVPMPEPIIHAPDPVQEDTLSKEPVKADAVEENTAAEQPEEAPLADSSEDPAPAEPPQPEVDTVDAPASVPAPSVSDVKEAPTKKRRSVARWLVSIILLILLAGLIFAGNTYYRNVYLQAIDSLVITGTESSITVQILTEVDESLLLVTCSDTYGNTLTARVNNGTAIFTDLSPGTRYTIRVAIEGTHKLIGQTTDSFTTDTLTIVENFTAVIGPEDGSVYLSFTVNGVESDEWCLSYEAPGIDAQTIVFAGHSVTVYDLSVGNEYSFTLSSNDEANVVGQTQLTYLARTVTRAQNPVITACGNGSLTVQWEMPEDETVTQWTVRCYDGSGYDQTITTNHCSFTFNGLSHETACTIEIIADGMKQGVSVSIEADPLNITAFTQAVVEDGQILVSWQFTGTAPENGWIVNWCHDGGEIQTLETLEPQVFIPYIPNSEYTLSLIPANGAVIFGHTHNFTAPEAELFSGYGITKANLQFMLCAVPGTPGWTWDSIPEDSYKSNFKPGETAGFVVWCDGPMDEADEMLSITFILRDQNGALLDISEIDAAWNSMWNLGFTELDIPVMPQSPGSYRLYIYWNGMLTTAQDFTVE